MRRPRPAAAIAAAGACHVVLEIAEVDQYGGSGAVYVSSLDQTDLTPASGSAPLATAFTNAIAIGIGPLRVMTSTTSTFRYRTTTSTDVRFATLGWQHPRGRNN